MSLYLLDYDRETVTQQGVCNRREWLLLSHDPLVINTSARGPIKHVPNAREIMSQIVPVEVDSCPFIVIMLPMPLIPRRKHFTEILSIH